MSAEEMILTVLIGVFVLFVTFFLAYGTVTYFHERERVVGVFFALTALCLLVAYFYVVINRVFG